MAVVMMSGHYVYIPQERHRCETPEVERVSIGVFEPPLGSIWQCDECATYWRFGYTEESWGAVWYRPFWRNLLSRMLPGNREERHGGHVAGKNSADLETPSGLRNLPPSTAVQQWVIEFDGRPDNGPRLVGPFQSSLDADEWVDSIFVFGRSASFRCVPLTPPEQGGRR